MRRLHCTRPKQPWDIALHLFCHRVCRACFEPQKERMTKSKSQSIHPSTTRAAFFSVCCVCRTLCLPWRHRVFTPIDQDCDQLTSITAGPIPPTRIFGEQINGGFNLPSYLLFQSCFQEWTIGAWYVQQMLLQPGH